MGFSPEQVKTQDIEKRVRLYKEANKLRREKADLLKHIPLKIHSERSFHKRSKTSRGQDPQVRQVSRSPYISRTSLSPSPIKVKATRGSSRKRGNKSYSALSSIAEQAARNRSRSPILNRLSHQNNKARRTPYNIGNISNSLESLSFHTKHHQIAEEEGSPSKPHET